MKKTVCLIQGHPDPASPHLGHMLADAYAAGAAEKGHTCRRVEVAALDFPLLRSQQAFETDSPPSDIQWAQENLAAAAHVVLIYPMWLGTMPALTKGFLEQTLRPGFAFDYAEKGLPKKRLGGRSARIVVTMGMPAFAYRWFYHAHSLRSLERNILKFCGFGPVRLTLIGGVGSLDGARGEKLRKKLRTLGHGAR
jgi:putative NADPH-quinone reductase